MKINSLKSMLLMILGSGFLLTSTAGFGHHSHAMFDDSQELTISGKVLGIRFVNPHVRMLMEVENANGEMERWDIEMSTVSNMMSRGINATTFCTGCDISISVNPLRDGGHGGNYTRVESINGMMNTAEGGTWVRSAN